MPSPAPPIHSDATPRVDVAIIGGGFAGASTAYHLAAHTDLTAVILEAEPTWGYHASGRNAAMCRQLTELDSITEYTVRGAELLRDPPRDIHAESLVSSCGSILLVDCDDDATALLETARRWDVEATRWDMAAVVDAVPRLAGAPAACGVWVPSDGVIDIHSLLSGLIAGARARGVDCRLGARVTRIARSAPDDVVVSGSFGRVRARCVVVASGAWAQATGQLAGVTRRYNPIRRHLFTTEPEIGLNRDAPFVWHIGAEEFYVRPEGRGYLVSGCDETVVEPHDAVAASDAVFQLADKLAQLAPGLAELGIDRRWACLRTFFSGGGFVIDWDPDIPWLFWVAGLGGHGATTSLAVGEAAAAKLGARLSGRWVNSATAAR